MSLLMFLQPKLCYAAKAHDSDSSTQAHIFVLIVVLI